MPEIDVKKHNDAYLAAIARLANIIDAYDPSSPNPMHQAPIAAVMATLTLGDINDAICKVVEATKDAPNPDSLIGELAPKEWPTYFESFEHLPGCRHAINLGAEVIRDQIAAGVAQPSPAACGHIIGLLSLMRFIDALKDPERARTATAARLLATVIATTDRLAAQVTAAAENVSELVAKTLQASTPNNAQPLSPN